MRIDKTFDKISTNMKPDAPNFIYAPTPAVSFIENPFFIGRRAELERLRSFINPHNTKQILSLEGSSMAGKSTLLNKIGCECVHDGIKADYYDFRFVDSGSHAFTILEKTIGLLNPPGTTYMSAGVRGVLQHNNKEYWEAVESQNVTAATVRRISDAYSRGEDVEFKYPRFAQYRLDRTEVTNMVLDEAKRIPNPPRTVFLFDSYEATDGDTQDWLEGFMRELCETKRDVKFIVAGKVPLEIDRRYGERLILEPLDPRLIVEAWQKQARILQ